MGSLRGGSVAASCDRPDLRGTRAPHVGRALFLDLFLEWAAVAGVHARSMGERSRKPGPPAFRRPRSLAVDADRHRDWLDRAGVFVLRRQERRRSWTSRSSGARGMAVAVRRRVLRGCGRSRDGAVLAAGIQVTERAKAGLAAGGIAAGIALAGA